MKQALQDINELRRKKLIVFDIDGTLTPSKAPADKEMIQLMLHLLDEKSVAIIGGGKYSLFKEQLIEQLPQQDKRLERLFLFPTNSTAFYRFNDSWHEVYSHQLTEEEKDKIKTAFDETFREVNYQHPEKTYGSVIEDRDTQITFSALGQEVVAMCGEKIGVQLKEEWHKNYNELRQQMREILQKLLPEFEVRAGGLTSIDITRKGIDKAYGVRQIAEHLGVKIEDMLFVGDAIFPGGNDYAALQTGIDYVKVKAPTETKELIRTLTS
jgi:HAD superfamily hydrolase (TIGR01484 family)